MCKTEKATLRKYPSSKERVHSLEQEHQRIEISANKRKDSKKENPNKSSDAQLVKKSEDALIRLEWNPREEDSEKTKVEDTVCMLPIQNSLNNHL